MCRRMAALDQITITVDKVVEPFKHKVEQTRAIFVAHSNCEYLLDENHKSVLSNYEQLHGLGPHPLLAYQTNEKAPNRWVNIRLQVKDKETTDWVTLVLREDNLYVKGFTNEHNSHELSVPLKTTRRVRGHWRGDAASTVDKSSSNVGKPHCAAGMGSHLQGIVGA